MLPCKGVKYGHNRPGRGLRSSAISTDQNQSREMWFAIKSNISDHSMDKDKYQEGTGQKKVRKHLR